MGKFIDMTGWIMSEHGIPDSRLTVIERVKDEIDPKSGKPKVMWKCMCNCADNKFCVVAGSQLRSKSSPTKSCGCIQKEKQWTEEQINILKIMYLNGGKVQDIANKIGKTNGAVSSKAEDLGLTKLLIKPNNPNFKAAYQNYDWCYERYINRSMTMQEMAGEAGTTLRTIQKWCQDRFGLNARSFKEHKKISELQKQIIMFGKLGDGHIDRRENQPMYIESHADNQKDYIFWKWSILKDLCAQEPVYYPEYVHYFGNKPYNCRAHYRICTRIINDLKPIRDMNNYDILLQLNEFGLSIHTLDDGCRSDSQWQVCVAEWTDDEVALYLTICKEKFGIIGKRLKDERYVEFTADSSRLLDKIILRNIPNDLDIIKYKILERHITKKQNYQYVKYGEDIIGLSSYCKQHNIQEPQRLFIRQILLDNDIDVISESELQDMLRGVIDE